MNRRSVTLLVLASIVSVGLFVYGAMWSIVHGGYWEDGSRPRPLLQIEAAEPASIVRPRSSDDWLTDPANWEEIIPDRAAIVLEGSERYCVVNRRVIVAGTTPPDDPAGIEVIADVESGRCFPTMRTLLTIDDNREVRFEELPDPTEPVWGYILFAFSWLPIAAAGIAIRRRTRTASTATRGPVDRTV